MSHATTIALKLTAAAVLFAVCVAGLVTTPPALAKTAPKPGATSAKSPAIPASGTFGTDPPGRFQPSAGDLDGWEEVP